MTTVGAVTRTDVARCPSTENVARSGSRVVSATLSRDPRAQKAVCRCVGELPFQPSQKTSGRWGSGSFGCPRGCPGPKSVIAPSRAISP